MTLCEILAQVPPTTTGATTGQSQTPAPWWASNMIPLMGGVLLLYFFVFRSKRTQDKKRQGMLSQMKKGDRVQTIGGILGKVIETGEDRVLLKVDESSNTKIWFSRSAIHRVIEEDNAAAPK